MVWMEKGNDKRNVPTNKIAEMKRRGYRYSYASDNSSSTQNTSDTLINDIATYAILSDSGNSDYGSPCTDTSSSIDVGGGFGSFDS